MNTFCPFFNERCKGNECVMWKDEKCLVISFMEHLIAHQEEKFQGHEPLGRIIGRIREPEIPDEIRSATSEELAAELVSLAKKEFPDEERIKISQIIDLFLETKKVNSWDLPAEIELKIEKAEKLAQRALDNEKINKEKNMLPSLIDLCVDWAKDRGLGRVTKTDIEVFLISQNTKILPQTQRELYLQVNVKLKSKR